MLRRVIVPQTDRLEVRVQQVPLPLPERLLQEFADRLHVEIEERGEGARVADVLHQDARAAALEVLHAHLGQRHPDKMHVLPLERVRHRPARVVQQPAAGDEFLDVARVRLRIHGHDEVELRGARDVPRPVDADLVPGGETLDVRGEDVLPRHRHSHAEDRLHDEPVGARGPGAVHRRDLEREVVDASGFHAAHGVRAPPARGRREPWHRSPSPSRGGPRPVPRRA